MIKLDNELLNRYIDGELDAETSTMIAEQLTRSPEDKLRYEALLKVDKALKNISSFEVGSSFASKVMASVLQKNKNKKEQKVFILSVSSVFVILALIITGAVLSAILSSTNSSPSSSQVSGHVLTFAKDLGRFISSAMTAKNVSIIGSIISFGVIISGYFFFENMRHSKR